MNIITKYNINDTVFFTQNSKIIEGKVFSIVIPNTKTENYEIYYEVINDKSREFLTHTGIKRNFPENWLFSTKEELIASL